MGKSHPLAITGRRRSLECKYES